MIRISRFGAEWCSQCNRTKEEHKKIEQSVKEMYPEEIEWKNYDADEEDELVEAYNVQELPCIVIDSDNTQAHHLTGDSISKDNIIEYIEQILNGEQED